MGEMIRLKSRFDAHELPAYHAAPRDARRGGLVLAHDILGLTPHLLQTAEAWAEDGFEVLAPAFFDRVAPGWSGGHDEASLANGRAASQATSFRQAQGDLQAAIDALGAPVFVLGFSWGATAAWLAACRCDGLTAAAAYYGRRIAELAAETPKVPVILHYGKRDASIPPEAVDALSEAHPDLAVYLYDAGHSFASDDPAERNDDATRLARLRTQAHFARSGGGRGEV